MSDAISITSKLPDGDGNGLTAIRGNLISHPRQCHVIIGIVDCSKITTKPDTSEIIPTVRLRRIEVITGADITTAERLIQRALDSRLGQEQLPFDLEEDLRSAFGKDR